MTGPIARTVTMSLDDAPLQAALADLRSLLPELAQRAPEAFDALVGAIEAGAELFTLDVDGRPATAAGEVRLTAKPSDALAVLVAAGRAGNLDLSVVKHAFTPSVGVVATPTVTESPAGSEPAGGEAKANDGGMS